MGIETILNATCLNATNPLVSIECLIGNVFVDLFGNPIFLGLFGILFLSVFGLVLRLPADIFIPFLLIGLILIASEYLGLQIVYIFLIGVGILIAFALIRLIGR